MAAFPQHLRATPFLALIAATLGCARVDVHLTAYLARDAPFPPTSTEDSESPDTHAQEPQDRSAPDEKNAIAVVVRSDQEPSLLEAEVAAKVAALLRERGYAVAPVDQAAYVLSCRFSVDAGRRITRAVPIHEFDRAYYSYYYGHGRTYYVRSTTVPGYTRYVPEQYTVYMHRLSLSLIKLDLPAAQRDGDLNGKPVWQCDAGAPGETDDLRWVVNHLLLAAFDHFGEDSGRQIRVSLSWNDGRVKRLARTETP